MESHLYGGPLDKQTKRENRDALHSNNHEHKQQEQTSLTSIDAHTQTYLSSQQRCPKEKGVIERT